ncbi:hypothetical protein TSUD_153810 [Trifolium subterraneum]|uniref:Uncharacterized protein n=1 Tax=Trifolium subterraneum TaxID=3900 RepID=A0A2Z6MZ34_TRISU|nr:hypothetical protein TSUD_153810 [Trifolium subterraneum]
MKSASGGQISPIPKAMIDMLAKMALEEEGSGADSTPAAETTRTPDIRREQGRNRQPNSPNTDKGQPQITQSSSQGQLSAQGYHQKV